MRVPLTVRDFLDRGELVYGDRVALVDEPEQPAASWGSLTYRELGAEVARHVAREGHQRIAEELADLAIYIKLMAHDLGIDLEEAVRAKIEKNRAKYPVEKSRGTAKKYDEL